MAMNQDKYENGKEPAFHAFKVLEPLSVAKMMILYVIGPPHTAEP